MSSNLLPQTIDNWTIESINKLKSAQIETARLDCLVLLADELQVDKSYILAHPEEVLQIEFIKILNTKIAQRSRGIPLAYIRGVAEFYGRTFCVNSDVLVPRPESEAMIDLLKTLDLPNNAQLLDVGTGSGCLGITAAIELKVTKVDLLDIDPTALTVAKRNAENHLVTAGYMVSDILQNVRRNYDVYLANLPYVPKDYPINYAAKHEPEHALFAGKDGLDAYRQLFMQLQQKSHADSFYVLTESLIAQHDALRQLAQTHGLILHSHQDLVHCFKYVGAH